MAAPTRIAPPEAGLRGRGATANPASRFESSWFEPDPGFDPPETATRTRFLNDATRTVLARNTSPDVPFTFSLNPYRGCEHGCVYCYARPSHEYLGFSAGLDFESRILVKHAAADLLCAAFDRPSWVPQVVALSGNTDPYQPVERKLGITRRCLDVFLRYQNPVGVITKNHLVVRDVDLLVELARRDLVTVTLSVTTLSEALTGAMEPRTARPSARLRAIERLAHAGVPVGVNVAPVIPGLNDEEIPSILSAAADAGARRANYIVLRLPGAVAPLFERWLTERLPDRASRIMGRIRECRAGGVSDSRFGVRMRGEGEWADMVGRLFRAGLRRSGLSTSWPALRTDLFSRDAGRGQGDLFAR